jgi:hypothetical protein
MAIENMTSIISLMHSRFEIEPLIRSDTFELDKCCHSTNKQLQNDTKWAVTRIQDYS